MGKDSSFNVGILRFANQVLIVVKQSALRLPTRALLRWGNLSRDQLLQKAYSIRKTYRVDYFSLKSFRAYLSDWKQQTLINGAQSDFCNMTCGIMCTGLYLRISIVLLFTLTIFLQLICFQNPNCMQMILLPHLRKIHINLYPWAQNELCYELNSAMPYSKQINS